MYEENEKKVQTILERGVGILARNYGVRKLDAGDFSAPVTLNTQFRIAHYEIENVGHLMTMYTENNPQLLMATYTLTPYYKKLPLISSDFIFNGDGGMFLIEIYELVKNREAAPFQAWIRKYAELFDFPSEELQYAVIQVSRGHRKTGAGFGKYSSFSANVFRSPGRSFRKSICTGCVFPPAAISHLFFIALMSPVRTPVT